MGLLDGLFGGGGSSSNANDSRTDTSGAQAVGQRGTNDTAARDGALAIGTNGRFVGSGAVEQGANSKVLTPGSYDLSALHLGNNASLTINESDPAVLKDALQQISTLAQGTSVSLGDYLDKVTASEQATAAASQTSQDKVLTEISDLSKAQATGGQSIFNNTVLWIVIAALAAGVAIVFFWRKK